MKATVKLAANLCQFAVSGAFLIPYVFFVVFVGLPLIILEISVGQRFRRGLSNSWGLIPIAKGNRISIFNCIKVFLEEKKSLH